MSICPKVTSQGVNGAVIAQLIDLYKDSLLGNITPAYEGRNDLYTAGHLPIESKEFVIKLVDRDVHTKSTRFVFKLIHCPYFVKFNFCYFFFSNLSCF